MFILNSFKIILLSTHHMNLNKLKQCPMTQLPELCQPARCWLAWSTHDRAVAGSTRHALASLISAFGSLCPFWAPLTSLDHFLPFLLSWEPILTYLEAWLLTYFSFQRVKTIPKANMGSFNMFCPHTHIS